MQQRDHRQLDLIGDVLHPHGAQLAVVMAAILRGACCLQSRPAMHRIDDLLKNSRQADLANWYRCEGAR